MVKNTKNKQRNDTYPLSKVDHAKKRAQFDKDRAERRTKRIEKAKRTLREEETRADLIKRAKQILVEEELAGRIEETRKALDEMRQKLRDLRTENRSEIKKIREVLGVGRPVSDKERARRKERFKFVQEHKLNTLELIKEIQERHYPSEVFEMLPYQKALLVSGISYGDVADLLNKQKHYAVHGNKWTRTDIGLAQPL